MSKTNAEIAALRDPDAKNLMLWRRAHKYCRKVHRKNFPKYTGPDFATDDIACFKELRPVLLAMGCDILERNESRGTAVKLVDGRCVGFADHYAAALTAAFSWAMDNQPEALRRACEEVERAV